MRKTTLALSAILLSAFANAQGTCFAPVLGFNVSKYAVNGLSFRPRYGIRVGILGNSPISDHLYFQPGAYYVMNGFRADGPDPIDALSIDINTLEIPLNVTLKCNKENDDRLFLSVGPYVGINLSGTVNTSGPVLFQNQWTTSFPLGISTDEDSDFGRLDFGLNAGIGMELAKGFLLRGYYQRGLLLHSMSSTNCGVTVGYFIGKKAKSHHQKTKSTASPNSTN